MALSWSHAALAGSGDFNVLPAPSTDTGGDRGFPGLAAEVRTAGAEYVVLPVPPSGRKDATEPLAQSFRAAWTTVLDHRHVCAVFSPPRGKR
jgi:hypothetical protein